MARQWVQWGALVSVDNSCQRKCKWKGSKNGLCSLPDLKCKCTAENLPLETGIRQLYEVQANSTKYLLKDWFVNWKCCLRATVKRSLSSLELYGMVSQLKRNLQTCKDVQKLSLNTVILILFSFCCVRNTKAVF